MDLIMTTFRDLEFLVKCIDNFGDGSNNTKNKQWFSCLYVDCKANLIHSDEFDEYYDRPKKWVSVVVVTLVVYIW